MKLFYVNSDLNSSYADLLVAAENEQEAIDKYKRLIPLHLQMNAEELKAFGACNVKVVQEFEDGVIYLDDGRF